MKDKYLVHEIAKHFGVSCDTIRYYDKLGIITSKKDKNNNYRYYDRGDIICFSYVFALKNIGLTLEQIKIMLNDSSLQHAAKTLEVHEQLLDLKIKELSLLKSIVNDYKVIFNYAIDNFEKIEIIESPAVIYKEIVEPDGSVIENLKFFDKLTLKHEPLYTFCVDKELFLSEKFSTSDGVMESRKFFKVGLSLIDDENLILKDDFPAEDCIVLKPSRWLTSAIAFYTNKDYSSILKIRDYIIDNNLEIEGAILLRAISFKNSSKNNYDCYEVFIPLK